MRKTVAVMGGGLVGMLIAKELTLDYQVNVYDKNPDVYEKTSDLANCCGYIVDLSDPQEIRRTVVANDLIVIAVPGSLGYKILSVCVGMGKPVADISFSPSDPLQLDTWAKQTGARVVVDCGVAPGMSNLFAGHACTMLDTTSEITIMVGGLPITRIWPFDYNLVFSLTDVIEEYTRPCRYRENGHIIVRPALTDREYVDLPHCGTLEAFNTDGLRTLLTTLDVPTLKEKTLRFPGHIDKMMVFREAGFFDDVDIDVNGVQMNPRKLTEKLFAKSWNLPKDAEEFTVLRVDALGKVGSGYRRIVWDLYDRTNVQTKQTSMARTTGFPCVTMLRLLDRSDWIKPGVWPLEKLASNQLIVDSLIGELELQGIEITCKVTETILSGR
jgi:saccharopine dehydrogenase-like NADP-dependent oxidoreductase